MDELRTFLAGCVGTALVAALLIGGCFWFVQVWYGSQAVATFGADPRP